MASHRVLRPDLALGDAEWLVGPPRPPRKGGIGESGQARTAEHHDLLGLEAIDDVDQARAAAQAGADVIAVIRSTAQSLLDYVPHGATTEGYGGTYATQENFRIMREALDDESKRLKRYVELTNYSSGLCMSEIAFCAAWERLDMLLNDAMYGILFRDINPRRTLCDQYFSRRIISRAGIIINTGEDNYLTTADAVDKAYTVLASQFINEAFALRAGLREEQMGLGHAFEIDPWHEDSLLLEIAQAQLVRQIFDRHPIKWMPPTKFKTGDIFHSHVHDAMFNLVGVATKQSIELLGMFSEAVHTPSRSLTTRLGRPKRSLSFAATRPSTPGCRSARTIESSGGTALSARIFSMAPSTASLVWRWRSALSSSRRARAAPPSSSAARAMSGSAKRPAALMRGPMVKTRSVTPKRFFTLAIPSMDLIPGLGESFSCFTP